jgi:uncharacterized LabA/DUF88 family protein
LLKPLYAILIDGGFLTKKLQQRYGRQVTADDVVAETDRLQRLQLLDGYELIRIYYYDAIPSSERTRRPVSKTQLNLADTSRFRASQSLFDQLVLRPNFALRMGQVNLSANNWRMKPRVARELLRSPRDLTDDDFELDIAQKGVDMRIGMDMARLALRDMVRALVVVTGDSDFVPAFKYVRREGLRVVLDPMGHNVRVELKAHADIVIEPERTAA